MSAVEIEHTLLELRVEPPNVFGSGGRWRIQAVCTRAAGSDTAARRVITRAMVCRSRSLLNGLAKNWWATAAARNASAWLEWPESTNRATSG